MKVKTFSEGAADDLELVIQDWLNENKSIVVEYFDMTFSTRGTVIAVIMYRNGGGQPTSRKTTPKQKLHKEEA